MRTFLIASVLLAAFASFATDDYQLGPDSMVKPGVPHGTLIKHTNFHSRVITNTVRDWWVYVPAQYDAAKPACVMVFQDGGGYIGTNGSYRVPTVFDNLIHSKEMPVTIGVSSIQGTGLTLPTSRLGEGGMGVRRARAIGAWNTIRWASFMRDFCWRKSCRRCRRTIT